MAAFIAIPDQAELELLAELHRVCGQAPLYETELWAGHLSAAAQEAYAWRLIDVAKQMLRHARNRRAGLTVPIQDRGHG